jgi:anhydro-N-acetylmuramic acid kinase
MSGTSVDGIDAALVEIYGTPQHLQLRLLAGETYPYPPSLREKILAVCGGLPLSFAELAQLDDEIAIAFTHAAHSIQQGQPQVDLIGSHGQTVFHRPPVLTGSLPLGYSLQLGRGEAIAHLTQTPTVSNFRVADIAAQGQGAPLVPKVDAYLLSHDFQSRCVQNLGGIGNVTYLPPRSDPAWETQVIGWDTGPGNLLIDLAVQELTQGRQAYDRNGSWAAQGTPCQALITHWLQDPFFKQIPPKSTGREHFGLNYLHQCQRDADDYELSEADWLATLTEFTVASVVDSYRRFLPAMPSTMLLCGGGTQNNYLKQRLVAALQPDTQVLTTDDAGMSSEFKEAIAFAILAYWRFHGNFPGNLPAVTGAAQPCLLGEIFLPHPKLG